LIAHHPLRRSPLLLQQLSPGPPPGPSLLPQHQYQSSLVARLIAHHPLRRSPLLLQQLSHGPLPMFSLQLPQMLGLRVHIIHNQSPKQHHHSPLFHPRLLLHLLPQALHRQLLQTLNTQVSRASSATQNQLSLSGTEQGGLSRNTANQPARSPLVPRADSSSSASEAPVSSLPLVPEDLIDLTSEAPPGYTPSLNNPDPTVRALSQQTRDKGRITIQPYTSTGYIDAVKLLYVGMTMFELTPRERGTPTYLHSSFRKSYSACGMPCPIDWCGRCHGR